MVHGGERFSESVLLNKEVLEAFTACNDLAPLHNPANLKGVNAVSAILPNIPQVGVFDTAFHQTMPDYAYMYAIPHELYEKYGVRRYGCLLYTSSAVKIPFSVSPRLAYAPYLLLISIAVEVPTA